MAAMALLFPIGCGFDAVKAREACEKLHADDPTKAEECIKTAEAAYKADRWRFYRDAKEIKH
jgi:hypothetical protein